MAAAAILAAPAPAPAAPDAPAGDATPLTEFRGQVGSVRSSLESLNKKIEQSAREIEALSKPEAARKQMAELQGLLADTLGLVSDNGAIATLGTKALGYARGKLKQIENETRFAADEKASLLQTWKRNVEEMERATNELASAGRDFSQQLRIIQTRGDYAAEVAEAENAQQMVEVIRRLAADVRSASEVMKTYIRSLSAPGA